MLKRLPPGVVLLGLVSFFNDTASEAIYPLLPVFIVNTIGAGPVFIGVLEGLAESLASILKILVGIWSDRIGKREPFVNAGYALAGFARPFIGLSTQSWHVFAIRLLDRTGKGLRSAPRDAWLGSLSLPSERGRVFGFHRAMDHAGSVAGPLLAAGFLLFWPGSYKELFLCASIPGLIAVILAVLTSKKYPAHKEFDSAENEAMRPDFSISELTVDQKLYFLALGVFTLGNSTDAFLLLKLNQSGLKPAFLPVAWAGLHIVKSVASIVFGTIADKTGSKVLILSGWALYVIIYLVFGISGSLAINLMVFLIYGIFYGLTESPEKAWITKMSSHRNYGKLFGLYHFVVGLGSLPSSILFGVVWQYFGAGAAFSMGAAFAGVAVGILLFALESPHPSRAPN